MTRTRPLLAVLAVAAVVLSACARTKPQGPDTTAAPSADPAFCKGIADFRVATANLNSQTLQNDPAEVVRELTAAHGLLLQLVDKAPTAVLKADIRTVADNYDTFLKALPSPTGSAQALIDAATAFSAKPEVTKATADLNSYGHTICGLNTEIPPTTTTPTTSVGPVAPAETTTSTTG